MSMEIIINCRSCGTKLSTKPDSKPKWYGIYQGWKPISGACEECYKKEKEAK